MNLRMFLLRYCYGSGAHDRFGSLILLLSSDLMKFPLEVEIEKLGWRSQVLFLINWIWF